MKHTPLLAVADVFTDNKSHFESEVREISCRYLRLKLRGEQDVISWHARKEEEKYTLDERDEREVEEKEHHSRNLAFDYLPKIYCVSFVADLHWYKTPADIRQAYQR